MHWRNVEKRKNEYLPLLTRKNAVFCCFDLETTGLTNDDKVIQFSAAKYTFEDNKFTEIASINTYIDPCMAIPLKITNLTGITDEILADAPKENEICQDIFEFINNSDIWFGYNIKFDIRMIKNMARRNNEIFQKHPIQVHPVIDVLEIVRDLVDTDLIGDHKLCNVSEYLLPGKYKFHDAADDVRATMSVLECLYPDMIEYKDEGRTEYSHLEKASIWESPYKKEARIKLKLSDGSFGDIYYNLYEHRWECKKNAAAVRLFNSLNMADIENQFMDKYGKFGYRSVDEVGFVWLKFKKDKEKEKKNTVVK